MAALDDLLAPFLIGTDAPDAGNQVSFSYEPFTLPIRAYAGSLAGYEAEIAAIEAMDAPPGSPSMLEDPFQLPLNAINTAPIAEAGANITTQLAALLHGLANYESQEATPTLYWQCGLGANFWEDLALLRAGKALIYEYFTFEGNPVFILKICAVGRMADMTPADGYTNLLRLSTHALTAHAAGVDMLYLPPFAENAPGLEQLRERIHQVVEHESLVGTYGQAQKGAYWPTLLAAKLMQSAKELAYTKKDLFAEAALTFAQKRADVEAGKRAWIGQTIYANHALTIPGPQASGLVEW